MRYSHQRQLILEAVKAVKTHPTADAVYEDIRKKEPTISLGTVYRNLNLLESTGEIDALHTSDNKVHYDGDTSPHSHFICTCCKRIVDVFVNPEVPEELLRSGFEVEKEKVIYYGKCTECAKLKRS